MTIDRATIKDQPDIERLLEQVCKVHADIRPDLFIEGKRKYTKEELAAIIEDDGRPIFVAHDDDGTLMGYCFTVTEEHRGFNDPPHRTLYIDDLCVDENTRGRHVGKKLYDYVTGWAKDHGFYNITLHVWEGNDSAKAFYESMGLKIQLYGMETVL